MFSKITTRLLFCLGAEIALLLGTLTPVEGQQIYTVTPVSPESISTAENLSQQAQAKAEILDYRGAITDLNKAIQLNPNEADFYYQRGVILGKLSDRQSAVQDFDDAILRDPNHAWAYLHRGGMSLDFGFNDRITDTIGFNYRIETRVTRDRRGDGRAILDLRTARDLFAQQGDKEGYETADQLIQHFAGSLESETKQKS